MDSVHHFIKCLSSSASITAKLPCPFFSWLKRKFDHVSLLFKLLSMAPPLLKTKSHSPYHDLKKLFKILLCCFCALISYTTPHSLCFSHTGLLFLE